MLSLFSFGQRSGIGTINPDASAAYEIKSTTGGFLPPRMTQAQRNAIALTAGLLIFNTDSNCLEFYNGKQWFNLCNGGSSIKITTQPIAPAPTCPGNGIQKLSVAATGVALSYSWRKNGVVLVNNSVVSGQGTATLTLTNPQVSDAGNYEVVVSDSSWAVVSYNVPVVVYDTSIAYVNGEQQIDTYLLSAYSPGATIHWYTTPTGGTAIATGPQYKIPDNLNYMTYYVDAKVAGCVTPTRTKVEVVPQVILSPSGKTWMAYNLGATAMAKSPTDYKQYGSRYQWGRASDGHQFVNWTSSTTGAFINGIHPTLGSTTYTPNHSMLINTDPTYSSDNKYNWFTPVNNSLWQGVSGINNPCPKGFRIPTKDDITNEIPHYKILKLPHTGEMDSSLNNPGFFPGDEGGYWTSNIELISTFNYTTGGVFLMSEDTDQFYYFNPGSKKIIPMSIRCIKD